MARNASETMKPFRFFLLSRCFFSFSLLVGMKLFNSYYVAKNSVLYDKMTSAYMTEFVSYNVIDRDYLQKIGEKV